MMSKFRISNIHMATCEPYRFESISQTAAKVRLEDLDKAIHDSEAQDDWDRVSL